LNRPVRRCTIFEKVDDDAAFEAVLEEAWEQGDVRLLGLCLPRIGEEIMSTSCDSTRSWHCSRRGHSKLVRISGWSVWLWLSTMIL
jgi:hypothetical protein